MRLKTNIPEDLKHLKSEGDALDQSVALNRIVLAMLDGYKRQNLFLSILLFVSILANIAIAAIFIQYESQWEHETTTTTITQDTGEGSGNNVYQAGENATYTQEGVNDDGETNGDNNKDNPEKSNQPE